jgi:peptidoglycan L-alanyl-D-glutamate endopeptidase CwlK
LDVEISEVLFTHRQQRLGLRYGRRLLLKRGAYGDTVKRLQEQLAIGADGHFGPRTEKAVRDYQKKNGLVADGMAGPATLAHMKLFKELTADTATASRGSAPR